MTDAKSPALPPKTHTFSPHSCVESNFATYPDGFGRTFGRAGMPALSKTEACLFGTKGGGTDQRFYLGGRTNNPWQQHIFHMGVGNKEKEYFWDTYHKGLAKKKESKRQDRRGGMAPESNAFGLTAPEGLAAVLAGVAGLECGGTSQRTRPCSVASNVTAMEREVRRSKRQLKREMQATMRAKNRVAKALGEQVMGDARDMLSRSRIGSRPKHPSNRQGAKTSLEPHPAHIDVVRMSQQPKGWAGPDYSIVPTHHALVGGDQASTYHPVVTIHRPTF